MIPLGGFYRGLYRSYYFNLNLFILRRPKEAEIFELKDGLGFFELARI